MAGKEEKDTGRGIVVGGIAGTVLGATIAALLARRAEAAELPADEKFNYLLECQTAIVQLLSQMVEGNQAILALFQIPGAPELEVTVKTRWQATEPCQIFSRAIVSAGTYYTDMMVDWTRGKRLLIKAESSLNQAVKLQVIGNTTDSKDLATDIGPEIDCPANGNTSVGPAWDDWQPYIGVRIGVAVAPTAGFLTMSAVIQE